MLKVGKDAEEIAVHLEGLHRKEEIREAHLEELHRKEEIREDHPEELPGKKEIREIPLEALPGKEEFKEVPPEALPGNEEVLLFHFSKTPPLPQMGPLFKMVPLPGLYVDNTGKLVRKYPPEEIHNNLVTLPPPDFPVILRKILDST